MGNSRTEVVTSAVNNRTVATYPLEKGTLVSVSAKINLPAILPSMIYARLSITADGANRENIIAVLAEGYIGSGVSVYWQGAIAMAQGWYLTIETWGRIATTVTIDAITN